MVLQARATGGIWFRYGDLTGVIDPGPGALVHIREASPELDPHRVRAILLTHKHLDHSNDVNVLAEAMTGGGFEKQGTVVLPDDAIHGDDPVFLKYIAKKVGQIFICEDGSPIELENGVSVEPVKHIHHGVNCFGYIFRKKGLPTWGLLSDTKPLEIFASRYRECEYISINATFPDKKPRLDHMSIEDVSELLTEIHPKLATLTHMGMIILQDADPEHFARDISTEKTRVLAARDGMVIDLENLSVVSPIKTPLQPSQYEIIS